MAKSRNDILFKFLGDSKGLERGSKTARKSLGGVADTAKKVAGGIAIAFGAREVLQFGQDSITAATNYVESINAVEVATGAAAREIKMLGDTSATALGLTKTEVNEAAVAFAAFGEKIDTDGNISDTFEEFVTRATDFASVMNVDVDDALQKFQSGLAGETEPLRKFGIDISAASVSAFALANGIGETGKQLTEAEKVQARYGLLLKQTAKFQGDFANTADSAANQQKILNAEIEDAKIVLGTELMPVYLDFLKTSRLLLPVLKGQIKDVGNLVDAYKGISGALGDIVGLNPAALFSDMETTARSLGEVATRLNPILLGTDFVLEKLTGNTLGFKDAQSAVNPLIGTGTVLAGQYESALSGVSEELDRLGPKLKTSDELLAIFSGDLFKAARAARDLAAATAEVDKLFAGGGGSGQVSEVAAAQRTSDAIELNRRTSGGVIP